MLSDQLPATQPFLTQPVAEWLLQQLVTEPTDWPCFTKTGYRVYRRSPFNSPLILGQVNVEVSRKKLLQPTGFRVNCPGVGYTVLTVQCFTQTGFRVYQPSPFYYVCVQVDLPGASRWEVFTKKLLQPTGYIVYWPGLSYTAFIEQFTSPKLVTEPTNLVHSTWVDSRVEGQKVSLQIPFNRWLQPSTETTDLVPVTHWSKELQVLQGARADHPGMSHIIDWHLLSGDFLGYRKIHWTDCMPAGDPQEGKPTTRINLWLFKPKKAQRDTRLLARGGSIMGWLAMLRTNCCLTSLVTEK